MEKKTVNILGTEYTVTECEKSEDKRLCDCDGFCEKTTKEIVITKETTDSELTNWEWYRRKILRHEIIHAFSWNQDCKRILKIRGTEFQKLLLTGSLSNPQKSSSCFKNWIFCRRCDMNIKEFKKITIEKVDGKRTVTIDGEKMDLTNVTDINISLSTEPYIAIETVKRDLLEW